MVEVCRRGVPVDAVSTVLRAALVERMQQSDTDLFTLCGPPGIGKTMLASQYAASTGRPVLWCGLDGGELADARAAEHIRALLDGEQSPAEEDASGPWDQASSTMACGHDATAPIVVLDDCGVGSGDSLVGTVRALLRGIRRPVHQVIVTGRTMGSVTASDLIGAVVLERDDLAFTVSEARELCEMADADCTEIAVLDAVALTRGHAQLLALRWACRSAAPFQCEDLGSRDLAGARRLLQGLMSNPDLASLAALSTLGPCSPAEVDRVGGRGFASRLLEVARMVPVVSVERLPFGGAEAVLVEEVVGSLISAVAKSLPVEVELHAALQILQDRQDWAGCADILQLGGDVTGHVGFLGSHGRALVASGHAERAVDLIEFVRQAAVTQCDVPWLLLLHATALQAMGRVRDAVCVARQAATRADARASHDESARAHVLLAGLLLDLAERSPLIALAQDIDGLLEGPGVAAMEARSVTELRAVAHTIAVAVGTGVTGEAHDLGGNADEVSGLIASGDWASTCAQLESTGARVPLGGARRLDSRVLLAHALAHTGRLSRATDVIEHLTRDGAQATVALLAPLRAMISLVVGAEGDAAARLAEGIRAAEALGSRYDLAAVHLAQSAMHRCFGRHDESIACAERAVAMLHGVDLWGALDLARIELASALLAAGDLVAVDRLLGGFIPAAATGNREHAAWAGVLRALAHVRSGDVEHTRDHVLAHTDLIGSGALNLRIALYSKACPELLRLLALHMGAARIPGALLTMIDESTARRAIDSSQVLLSSDENETLGSRLLGAVAFHEHVSSTHGKPCTVRLLGGLEIQVGERIITEHDWRKRKARQLFAMLALHRGRDVARERIFDHLWPDMTEEQARNNFYVAWSTMKSALTGGTGRSEACPFVQSRRGRCRIDTRFVSLDIDEFEQLVNHCRDAMLRGSMRDLLGDLTRLDQVYRGELLPGDLYDDWFTEARERCRLDFLDTMAQGALSLAEHGRIMEALGFVRRALHEDPTREDLYQIEMRCQALCGQRTAAMDTFMRCRRRLAEDLGLDPSEQTRELYQQLLTCEDAPRDWKQLSSSN